MSLSYDIIRSGLFINLPCDFEDADKGHIDGPISHTVKLWRAVLDRVVADYFLEEDCIERERARNWFDNPGNLGYICDLAVLHPDWVHIVINKLVKGKNIKWEVAALGPRT